MVEVPTESYFCGVSFDDASSQCAQPCENGLCPNGEQCFAQTTCPGTQPGTYFCGRNIADARNCAIPCYSGSSAQCPTGQSCYAYTTCNAEAQTTPGESTVPGVSVNPSDPNEIPMVEVPTESYFCGVSFDDASSQCVQPCVNGLCPNGEECFAQTPCLGTQPGTYFCGRNIDDARNCAIPCPSGSSAQCPTGKSCYAYTTCNASNPAPSPPTESPTKKAMIPHVSEVVPAESFFCGGSYEDASDRCALPCSGGDSSDCPGIEQCYAYTPCNNPGSFFCGNSLENANEACAIPCPTGKSNTCPSGESCYAYTICNPITGSPTNKQTPNPTLPPPIIRDDIFPASASDFTFLDVLLNDDVAEGAVGPLKVMDVLPSPLPVDQNARQLQGGTNLGQLRGGDEEASTESTVASWDQPMEFSLGNAQVLPGGLPSTMGGLCEITGSRNRMRYTPPSMVSPLSNDPLPSTPFSDACLYQACDNNGNGGCGSGLITLDVFSEPTSKPTNLPTPLPTKWPTRKPTRLPTKYPTPNPTPYPTPNPTNYPTKWPTKDPTNYPTKSPTDFPTKYPTKNPTKFPTKYPTVSPSESPIIPVVFDVPEDSFYCGVTFAHASDVCGVPCPNGRDDCPPGLTCFGNTPCGDKKSFFCGSSYEDANESCTMPCPNGSANECPNGKSCFAYTMCKPITEEPTETPTESPTFKPTPRPTFKPTPNPTPKPTPYPTPSPTEKEETPEQPEEKSENISLDKDKEAENKPPKDKEDKEKPPKDKEDKEKPPEDKQEEEKPSKDKEDTEKPPKDKEDVETPDESESLLIVPTVCEDPLAMTVNQAYWRSWSSDRPETCNKFEPSDIDSTTYTHLVYSFASISSDGHLEPWAGAWDEVDKYKEFNKVKERRPGTKTLIAATEGVFYGAGMNPVTFNEVVETRASRMAFAQSVVSFLELYEFDGIDVDWDSPLDPDKGGSPGNYERYVLLAEEIRSAIDKSGKEYLFTIALPGTDWELYDYDLMGLSQFVDWFNLMSFDYHTPKNIPKTVGSHSDLKLIDSVVFDLIKDIAPTKFVLGMAAYGRTYSLADDRCKELGCPFRRPGLGGCGKTPGFLPFDEISEFIQSGSYDELHQDMSSSSMVAVVNDDQMISFDDETTWAIKYAYAEMMCLRGTMLWSIDMLSSKSPQHLREQNTRSLSASEISDSFRSCSICEPGASLELVADKRVSYAGNSTTCGELSASIHLSTKESSFTCSIARTSLTSLCCSEPATFENEDVSSLEPVPSAKPCNICQRDNIHHELKSEAKVEYKGALLSCLDMNSHLAKTEMQGSDICVATHSMLFDGCCYEKCSLCGGESLRWDATVKYNNQILSCDELPPMLTLATVRASSDQCDAMQAAYSSTCCFSPPKKKCTLCSDGEVNKHSFVKTKSSSLHCVNLVSDLAETEEEGSEACEGSKAAYSLACCTSPLLSNAKTSNFGQSAADYTPSSSSETRNVFKIPIWSLVIISSLMALCPL